MGKTRLSPILLFFWIAALVAVATLPGQALAQVKAYHMDRYDSNITVDAGGSMDIVETLTYAFTSGIFRRGLRTWDLDRVEDITVKSVTEIDNQGSVITRYIKGAFDPDDSANGIVGTYGTENTGTELRLRWIFGNTSNATRTFQIAYHVDGAIRVYATLDRLDWYAVPPMWGSSINSSRVTVSFPNGTNTSAWAVAAVPSDARVSKRANTITWSTGSISSGGFEVGADIPMSVLNTTKPSWQDAFDRQFPQQSAPLGGTSGTGGVTTPAPQIGMRSLIDFIIFGLSAVLPFGGILWWFLSWFTVR